MHNRGLRPLDLNLDIAMAQGLSGPIVPLGGCQHSLGLIAPGAKQTIETEFMALETGLRSILQTDVSLVEAASLALGAPTRYPLHSELFILVNPSASQGGSAPGGA